MKIVHKNITSSGLNVDLPHKICLCPNPGTCECYLSLKKDLQTERSSWIIQAGYKPNNKCPYWLHSRDSDAAMS